MIAWNDPLVIGGLFALIVLVLLMMVLRRAGKATDQVGAVAVQVGQLTQNMLALGQGQQQLDSNLRMVNEAQAATQLKVVQTMETRLAEVQAQMADRLADNAIKSARSLAEMQERMKDSLSGSSERTTKSLSELQERLATIDKAQTNIEKLSGDVLSLQDILSNKQTRGAFGEIQLQDIVSKALPSDSYSWQPTLSNGTRPDCLIHLPNPPGPIVIDAKFPLEGYEALMACDSKTDRDRALKSFGASIKVHIDKIAHSYLIEGETADGALMFLPSEAVYAELHANLPHIVRAGFAAKVWIVSPTTCMATLNTMRAILKDARMRQQAGAIRKELALLGGDIDRLVTRVGNLDRHFGQAAKDIEEIKLSADKAGKRAHKLDSFDFQELQGDPPQQNIAVMPPQ